MIIELNISFGMDQEKGVDKLLNSMDPKPVYTKTEKNGLHYHIQFEHTYQIYLFGHQQAKINPFEDP